MECGEGVSLELGSKALEDWPTILPQVLTEIRARGCHIADQIRALLKAGFPHGADALWRTLHELDVVASVIAADGPELAERYVLHDVVTNAKDARAYQQYTEELGQDPYSDQEMAVIADAEATVLAKYGRRFKAEYGWAADAVPCENNRSPGIADLEHHAGLPHFGPYRNLGSARLHAGSKGTRLNRVQFRGSWVMRAGPTNAGLAEVAHRSLLSLCRITLTLRLQGLPLTADPTPLITVIAILELADDAGTEFARVEEELRQEELSGMAD
jgi:hypothetical protein